MLGEQVWLLGAQRDTGKPRTPAFRVAVDLAVLLDLTDEGVATMTDDEVRVTGASASYPEAAGRLAAAADGRPLRLAYAVNALHPTWPVATEKVVGQGWAAEHARVLRPARVELTDRGLHKRSELVRSARMGLEQGLGGGLRRLVTVLWAADVAEFGLSRSLELTDHGVLDGVREALDADPLADRLAKVAALSHLIAQGSTGVGASGQAT